MPNGRTGGFATTAAELTGLLRDLDPQVEVARVFANPDRFIISGEAATPVAQGPEGSVPQSGGENGGDAGLAALQGI